MKIYFTPSNHRSSTSYNGSYSQGGLAMEAFMIFMLKFLERKMKVLLCLKMEKTKQGRKRVKNFVEFVKKRKTEWKLE